MTDTETSSTSPDTTIPADDTGADATLATAIAAKQSVADKEDPASKTNKSLWAGVGIGSAALVAALMYASKRPKRGGK